MRINRMESILKYIVILGLMIGSCIFYVMQRNVKQEQLNKLQYDGLQVLMEGMELSALFDDGEKLWAGTKEGIFLLDRNSGAIIGQIGEDLEMIYASGITKTEDGTMWAAHNRGVTGFLKNGDRIDFCAPDIPSGRVNTLVAEGNTVWGGTLQGGFLLEKTDGTWNVGKILDTEHGLSCNPVNVIYYDENFIWYGAYLNNNPGGISIQNRQTGLWQYISVKEKLCHPYINAFWPISNNKMLVATGQLTAGGLCVIEQDTSEQKWSVADVFSIDDNIPGEKVRWLYVDTDGHLWITTESNGLLLCKSVDEIETHPLNGIILTEDNGLSDNEIKCIAETEYAIWLGGKYGLTRVDRSLVKTLLE